MDKDETAQAIVALLEAAVDTAGPSRGLRGSDAGQVARQVDAGFSPLSFGVATLKQFIGTYAPQLRQVGASGLDPVYGRSEWPDLLVSSVGAIDDAWRTWVSPASHFALFVDRASGSVRVGSRTENPSEGEAVIEPAPAQVHRAAAQAFIDRPNFDPRCRDALSRALEDLSDAWWQKWQTTIRTQFPGCALAWAEHRRQALQGALEGRLREVTANSTAALTAYSAIGGSRIRRKHADFANPLPGAGPRGQTTTAASDQSRGRSYLIGLVRTAVGNMSERELRQVWLPLGTVLDALESQSNN